MRIVNYLILSLMILFCTASAEQLLQVEPDIFDFGRVPQNVDVTRRLVLKAIGDKPVKIDSITTYCECINIPIPEEEIAPGDSIIVELKLKTSYFAGNKEWRPYIQFNGLVKGVRIRVIAFIISEVRNQKRIYVFPHTVNASQFGDKVITKFPIKIFNKSEENVPLQMRYYEDDYFMVDFPLYVPPQDSAVGWITLNEDGIKSEFEKTIIFEYLNIDNEERLYSIPVRRKIFRSDN